ncbi:MAG TPA: hypothetical protein VJI46_03185 [Candidatus Nanoarchaeia archaeon]|nr:hypothetical protein [Candidatus Nanoarchaeia archaeon]
MKRRDFIYYSAIIPLIGCGSDGSKKNNSPGTPGDNTPTEPTEPTQPNLPTLLTFNAGYNERHGMMEVFYTPKDADSIELRVKEQAGPLTALEFLAAQQVPTNAVQNGTTQSVRADAKSYASYAFGALVARENRISGLYTAEATAGQLPWEKEASAFQMEYRDAAAFVNKYVDQLAEAMSRGMIVANRDGSVIQEEGERYITLPTEQIKELLLAFSDGNNGTNGAPDNGELRLLYFATGTSRFRDSNSISFYNVRNNGDFAVDSIPWQYFLPLMQNGVKEFGVDEVRARPD